MANQNPLIQTKITATTQQFLDIREIRDDVVVLADGSIRAVILCSTVNFELKSETEQNAIIYAYQSFLNSLTFPIQIVVQSRIMDLGPYLKKLEQRKKIETNELLLIQIADYIEFMNRLIQVTNVMDKKFYIVVPLSPPAALTKGLFAKVSPWKVGAVLSDTQFKAAKEAIKQRVDQVVSRIASVGIRAVPLKTDELIELFYAAYNPETAQKQPLALEAGLTEEVIRKAKS
jgi:hypothetical protein